MPDGMDFIRISPPAGILRGTVGLPVSKSISNRVLMLGFLSRGRIRLVNPSSSHDTLLLGELLSVIDRNRESGGEVLLDCGHAGTVMRFLTALAAVTPGRWLLTGSPRMQERPIGPLVEALRSLGAGITYQGREGFPPLRVEGRPFEGGQISIEAGISSQFITALLLIAPTLSGGLVLTLAGTAGSRPYIDMTINLLQRSGIPVREAEGTIRIPPADFRAATFTAEPDWSSAAFWYEALALAGEGELLLEGLSLDSIQGDSAVAALYRPLGVESMQEARGIRIRAIPRSADHFLEDLAHHPDLAQALAATCAGLGIEGRLTGLQSLKIKETDRLEALRSELSKTGARPRVTEGMALVIPPAGGGAGSREASPPVFDTWGDHRMAMALAPLCLTKGTVVIRDPAVVGKSYPGYWEEMAGAGFKINRP